MRCNGPLLLLVFFSLCFPSDAAQTLSSYYAHHVVEDPFGVIAPWNEGQNGPLDNRARIAVQVMKRYPWVDEKNAVMAAPDFIYNSHWSIQEDGTIRIPETNDWMCGDLGQRAWSIVKGFSAYYGYSGDSIAFLYVPLTADYIVDYAQTRDDHDWPRFPISTPTRGKAYGPCVQETRTQLDLCAIVGTEILRAYKLTENERYFEAAKHWGDVFAQKCNLDPTGPPWNRYTHPEVVGWSDELTGSVTLILEFLDELIRMGYTGQDRRIVSAREAGRRYLREELLPRWLENDTWGRNYWDWDNPVQCGIVSMCGDYIMKHPEAFPNWKQDLSNILTLIFNRNGADPNSVGDAYHGAWAFPESCTCCGTSLSYNQYTAAPTLLRLGSLAGNERILEIGRRMMIMAAYDSHEDGRVCDGIFGEAVATREWSNLAHPWPLCQVMEALSWTPELFGPKRENHIMRSTSVVNRVMYEKNRIEYATFDAPERTFDILRLSFRPTTVTADGTSLRELPILNGNGYTTRPLPDSDFILTIRHDRARTIVVEGEDDPQEQVDDDALRFSKEWNRTDSASSRGGSLHTCSVNAAKLEHAFKGNQVRVFGETGPEGGWAHVYMDGQREPTLMECWSPEGRSKQLLYYRNGLENKRHDLKIVVLGEANPISKGTGVGIDYVQHSMASAKSDFGEGSGPSGPQRMIFGYPERRDYVDSRGNTWRPATEWIVRSGYGKDTVEASWWTHRRSMHIGNTEDPELYRYGAHGKEFWVNLTVGPGTYYVTLKFADTPLHPFLERDEKGQRVSHALRVEINGRVSVERMIVSEEAGGLFRALDKTFENIEPRHGMIEIRLTGMDGKEAILQALELGPM